MISYQYAFLMPGSLTEQSRKIPGDEENISNFPQAIVSVINFNEYKNKEL